ncbi:MAG: MFS transporter [Bacteroidetes bacterium]|nr:MFS transporter [Bacteroidota bacterium]MCL5025694.1 MFS transporter [Chloroflexota bacterium]
MLSLPMLSFYALGFLSHLGMGIVSPNLPNIQEAFTISTTQVGLFMASFGLARLFLDLPVGMALDRVNRSVLMTMGLLIMASGALIAASATSFPMVVLGRSTMGAGSCMLNLTVLVHLNQASTREIRGRVIGIQQTAELTGSLLSPVIGGFLGGIYGWRAPFLFCAVIAVFSAGFVFVTRRLRASSGAGERGEGRPHQRASGTRADLYSPWRIVAIDFVTLSLFFSAAGFLNTAAPMYGGTVLGLRPEAIGLALAVGTIVRLFTSLGGAAISDRYGRRFVLIPALLILGLGTLSFNVVTSFPLYVTAVGFTGLGRLGNSVPVVLLADILPANRVARFIGLNRFVGDLGYIIGPLLVGWLIDISGYLAATLAVTGMLWTGATLATTVVREPARQPTARIRSDAPLA